MIRDVTPPSTNEVTLDLGVPAESVQLRLLVEAVALLADGVELVEGHLVEHAAALEADEGALGLQGVLQDRVV